MHIPRILLAAGASGSGKTLITCGLLQALVNRKMKVASFKCGPDYIDPMFHRKVIGTNSGNLDTFFTSEACTRYLLTEGAEDCDIAVMEGVMGYYDGVGGITTKASAYDLATVTDTPVILIVNSKGMSLSLAAYIKGFLDYKSDSHIKGIIFNQMSPMLYPRMKELIESELHTPVLGYVPKVENCVIESRHLGLVLPDEVSELKKRLMELADILEQTLDMERILKLAEEAPDIQETAKADIIPRGDSQCQPYHRYTSDLIYENKCIHKKLRLGVAQDEAFCFIYKENLRLLEQMGAELIRFSPIHDTALPENLDGLLLYGGYPELYGKELEENAGMRSAIRHALQSGMPCMAECGGFMYLHEEMEDISGTSRKMTGFIPGRVFHTGKLSRFGYIQLSRKTYPGNAVLHPSESACAVSAAAVHKKAIENIPAHEFHYYDSDNCGDTYIAVKPESSKSWSCMHDDGKVLAGFPHLYYYGNPKVPQEFLRRCQNYRNEQQRNFWRKAISVMNDNNTEKTL